MSTTNGKPLPPLNELVYSLANSIAAQNEVLKMYMAREKRVGDLFDLVNDRLSRMEKKWEDNQVAAEMMRTELEQHRKAEDEKKKTEEDERRKQLAAAYDKPSTAAGEIVDGVRKFDARTWYGLIAFGVVAAVVVAGLVVLKAKGVI